MKPDYERAATIATETLIKYGINTAPVDPLPILKQLPGVFVMTFAELSDLAHMDRKDLLSMYGCRNQDAVTNVYIYGGKKHYLVTYNRLLPARIVDTCLARELGHILLGHDGTRPEDVRQEEAKCFAHHLLCPRPLIHTIEAAGIRLTTDLVGHITGFPDHCLSCIRKQPGVFVPADLNRKVRDQFLPYVMNLVEFQRYTSLKDGSALADFGLYFDNYEE